MPYLVIKRLLVGVVLVFVVLTIIFGMLHLVPGDPARLLLQDAAHTTISEETLEMTRRELGLDKPLGVQYIEFLQNVAKGDLGTSFRYKVSVNELIAARLPRTVEVVVAATILASFFGIILGAIAGRYGGWVDRVISLIAGVGISIPVYVLGVLFVLFFALTFNWLPAGGHVPFSTDPVGHFKSLVLPAAATSINVGAIIIRMTRASVLEARGLPWVQTAKSWGIGPSRVFRRHILRNALNPVTTIIGLQLGTLLGSSVLIETIFNWPGVSSLLVDSVNERDYPVVQGIVIVLSGMFIAINIIVDIFYGKLDPRARL